MATALELVTPLLGALIPVPAIQTGICPMCRTAMDPKYPRCRSCSAAIKALGRDLPSIVPISMSLDSHQFHFELRKYKDSPAPQTRGELSLRLAALLAVFIRQHRQCIGNWDVITGVPSPTRLAMSSVFDRISGLTTTAPLLRANTDDWRPREAYPGRYQLADDVDGMSVLIVDDTMTTGASVFSAARTLIDGGATVIGPVVLGRHVNTNGWAPSKALMGWLQDRPWDPDRCGICSGEMERPNALF